MRRRNVACFISCDYQEIAPRDFRLFLEGVWGKIRLFPLDLQDAKRITGDFIDYYNTTGLHSAIGFIAPMDRLAGRHHAIHADRDKKLETARLRRKIALTGDLKRAGREGGKIWIEPLKK